MKFVFCDCCHNFAVLITKLRHLITIPKGEFRLQLTIYCHHPSGLTERFEVYRKRGNHIPNKCGFSVWLDSKTWCGWHFIIAGGQKANATRLALSPDWKVSEAGELEIEKRTTTTIRRIHLWLLSLIPAKIL